MTGVHNIFNIDEDKGAVNELQWTSDGQLLTLSTELVCLSVCLSICLSVRPSVCLVSECVWVGVSQSSVFESHWLCLTVH